VTLARPSGKAVRAQDFKGLADQPNINDVPVRARSLTILTKKHGDDGDA
jgi:hypothetical protein